MLLAFELDLLAMPLALGREILLMLLALRRNLLAMLLRVGGDVELVLLRVLLQPGLRLDMIADHVMGRAGLLDRHVLLRLLIVAMQIMRMDDHLGLHPE